MTDAGGCWPTPEQELLLRTLVSEDPERARQAWREWRARVDFENLDVGSFRMLPALQRRLVDLGIEDPVAGRVKGLWRRTWYMNQRLLRRAAELVEALRDAGAESLLLKGVALLLTTEIEPGARPMADVDILVPSHAMPVALDVFERLGLTPVAPHPVALMRVLHGAHFVGPDGIEVDVHCHFAQALCLGATDSEFWAWARSVEVRGVEALVPSATDQLLLAIVHGVQWNPVPPIRWVTDAAALLRGATDIDWERLLAVAESAELGLVMARGLAYLRRMELPVPGRVVEELARLPHSGWERLEMRLGESEEASRLFGNFPRTLLHYRRLSADRGWPARLLGLPSFLRDWWQLNSLAELPRVVAQKTRSRLRATLRRPPHPPSQR